MQHLTRAALNDHPPVLRSETVTVRWTDRDGLRREAQVSVVEMSVADRTRFDEVVLKLANESEDTQQGVREALAIACTRDADGRPLWTPDDAARLSGYGNAFLEPIVAVAQKLNPFDSFEDLAKNSAKTTAAAS